MFAYSHICVLYILWCKRSDGVQEQYELRFSDVNTFYITIYIFSCKKSKCCQTFSIFFFLLISRSRQGTLSIKYIWVKTFILHFAKVLEFHNEHPPWLYQNQKFVALNRFSTILSPFLMLRWLNLYEQSKVLSLTAAIKVSYSHYMWLIYYFIITNI